MFYPLFFLMFIYLGRENTGVWGGEGQREGEGEGERENPKQAHAVSAEPNTGLDAPNHEIMTRAKTKNWMLNLPSHPGILVYPLYNEEIGNRSHKIRVLD